MTDRPERAARAERAAAVLTVFADLCHEPGADIRMFALNELLPALADVFAPQEALDRLAAALRAEPPAAEDEDVRRLFRYALEARDDARAAACWPPHPVVDVMRDAAKRAEMTAFTALDRLVAENARLRTLVERQKAMIEDLDRQHSNEDGGP